MTGTARPRSPPPSASPVSPLWRALALLTHAGDVVGLRPRRAGRASPALARPDEVFRTTDRLEEALWTASALNAALDTGLLAALAAPLAAAEAAERSGLPEPIASAVLDVLVGLGFAEREGGLVRASPGLRSLAARPDGLRHLQAALHAPLLQTEDLRRRALERSLDLRGWRFTDPAVIEAQGQVTIALAEKAVPKLRFLPGLVPALNRPGARLLDVGAGAAGLSIALCRHFPALAATALEPAPGPAAVAVDKIREAGLSDRIALRRERIEDLAAEAAFDLVFLPQMFLGEEVIPHAARTAFRALKPRGWLLAPVLSRGGGDLRAAVTRLRNLLWGGNARTDEALRAHLRAAGFRPVIRSPGGGDALGMVCARRPPA